MNRDQSRDWKANFEGIRRILLTEWDPIGFGCFLPEDEYDRYIPQIYRLMRERVRVEDLASHLQEIETRQIGLPARPEVNRRVARMLLDWTG